MRARALVAGLALGLAFTDGLVSDPAEAATIDILSQESERWGNYVGTSGDGPIVASDPNPGPPWTGAGALVPFVRIRRSTGGGGGLRNRFYTDSTDTVINVDGMDIFIPSSLLPGNPRDFFAFDAEYAGADDAVEERRFNAKSFPVPEPVTLVLLGSGLVGLGAWGRRRRPRF